MGSLPQAALRVHSADSCHCDRKVQAMVKKISVLVLALGCVTHLGAAGRDGHDGADRPDSLARFDGGIGVIPVSNVVVNATTGAITVNRNIVRGVNPAGQIWM